MAKKHWRELGSISNERGKYRAYAYRLLMDGSTVREPKRFATEQEATAYIEQVKAENEIVERSIQSGQTEAIPTTIRKLLGAYFTYREQISRSRGKPKIETIWHQAETMQFAVLPYIGDLELASKVLSKQLSDFQTELHSRVSEKTGKPLSSSRKRHIMLPLSSALKWGAGRGYLDVAVLRDVHVPTQKKQQVRERAIPKKDSDKILAYLTKHGCKHSKGICALRWQLAYSMGLRQAETLGLSWSNIDLVQGELIANQQLKRKPWKHGCGLNLEKTSTNVRVWNCELEAQYCPKRHGGGLHLVEGTKTDEALHVPLPIHKQLLPTFIAHKKSQDAEIVTATTGKRPTADESVRQFWEGEHRLVFLQARTLRPYGARHDFTLWENLLEQCGIETGWRIHDLRHTTATNLAQLSNGNTHLIQKMLRHKSAVTTSAYIDPAKEELRKLAELYGEASLGLHATTASTEPTGETVLGDQ